jgi:hypothetical protein
MVMEHLISLALQIQKRSLPPSRNFLKRLTSRKRPPCPREVAAGRLGPTIKMNIGVELCA